MFKKILLGIVVVIGGFFGYVAMQPSDMLVARDILINAGPELIFPYINNSQKANEWMPWSESDPEAKMVFSGPAEGVGSITSWDSNGQMGTGQAEVVESIPNQSVKTKLTYTKPMVMSQLAEVVLIPSHAGTAVRWSVTGQNSFIGRALCVFMNMDKVVGSQFEKGLANLKNKVESH